MRTITLLTVIAYASATVANDAVPPELGAESPPSLVSESSPGQTNNKADSIPSDFPPELPFMSVGESNKNSKVPELGSVKEKITVNDGPKESLPVHDANGEEQIAGTEHKSKWKKSHNETSPGQKFNKLAEFGKDFPSGVTVKPKPGVTENVVIAINKLNRISTPYQNPKVITIDDVETKIDGSEIYVATGSDSVVSLYISDSDSNGAISLQLLPRDLAGPVEIKIEQDAKGALSSGAGLQLNSGGLMNHGVPYVNEIKRIMQAMAKRQIPQGFAMEENSPANLPTNICHDSGFAFMPGQVLTGQDSRIIVLVAQNNGSGVRLLDEAFCANEGVIAVSAWPKVRLHPGGKTEVYVLMRTPEAAGGEQIRPALF